MKALGGNGGVIAIDAARRNRARFQQRRNVPRHADFEPERTKSRSKRVPGRETGKTRPMCLSASFPGFPARHPNYPRRDAASRSGTTVVRRGVDLLHALFDRHVAIAALVLGGVQRLVGERHRRVVGRHAIRIHGHHAHAHGDVRLGFGIGVRDAQLAHRGQQAARNALAVGFVRAVQHRDQFFAAVARDEIERPAPRGITQRARKPGAGSRRRRCGRSDRCRP